MLCCLYATAKSLLLFYNVILLQLGSAMFCVSCFNVVGVANAAPVRLSVIVPVMPICSFASCHSASDSLLYTATLWLPAVYDTTCSG